jgi:hypothetical protein
MVIIRISSFVIQLTHAPLRKALTRVWERRRQLKAVGE